MPAIGRKASFPLWPMVDYEPTLLHAVIVRLGLDQSPNKVLLLALEPQRNAYANACVYLGRIFQYLRVTAM